MEFENNLKLATMLFEKKLTSLKKDYISKYPNYEKKKLDSYINKKLKKEINFLIKFNISN